MMKNMTPLDWDASRWSESLAYWYFRLRRSLNILHQKIDTNDILYSLKHSYSLITINIHLLACSLTKNLTLFYVNHSMFLVHSPCSMRIFQWISHRLWSIASQIRDEFHGFLINLHRYANMFYLFLKSLNSKMDIIRS